MTNHINRPAAWRPINRSIPQQIDHQETSSMTYDHRSTSLHRADLDREIETIRTERLMAAGEQPRIGIVERTRRGTGRVLIAAGTALIGRETAALRTRRA
jgi:hypothetical protein